MRGGTGQNHAVATGGKELCKVTTVAACVCNGMALVNHDDVPAGLLYPSTILTIVLQSINGDDGLIVILERVFIHRYLCSNLVNSIRVKTHQWYGKTIPYLLLELSKNALQCTDKDSAASASTNHLGQEDTDLYGLSQTHTISYQQTGTRELKSLQGRFELILIHVKTATVSNNNLL